MRLPQWIFIWTESVCRRTSARQCVLVARSMYLVFRNNRVPFVRVSWNDLLKRKARRRENVIEFFIVFPIFPIRNQKGQGRRGHVRLCNVIYFISLLQSKDGIWICSVSFNLLFFLDEADNYSGYNYRSRTTHCTLAIALTVVLVSLLAIFETRRCPETSASRIGLLYNAQYTFLSYIYYFYRKTVYYY